MAVDPRFAIALGQYEKALARLHELLPEPETTIVRDALIQRFDPVGVAVHRGDARLATR